MRRAGAILTLAVASAAPAFAASNTEATASRPQAQYDSVFFDDVETISPSLSPGFALGAAGSLTSNPSEVIAGSRSIKGSYFGTSSFTPYLTTVPSAIPFAPGQTYRVTLRYRILAAPDRGFEVLFFSPTAAGAGSFLPSITLTGSAGDTGTATLTNTLGPYNDYEARWNIVGVGAIAVDDIRIVNAISGQPVAEEDAEGVAPGIGPGLQLSNGASVVSDPGIVIGGKASLRLTRFGTVATNSAVIPLLASSTYVVELDYRILSRGDDNGILAVWFQPAGDSSLVARVDGSPLLKNAPASGTFSSGARLASAGLYALNIAASAGADVVIDNVRLFRQTVANSPIPVPWSKLNGLRYPRLGKYALASTLAQAISGGLAEGPPFRVSLDEVESTLAFADVIVGLDPLIETQLPDSVRRIRQSNPSAVILPYRIAEEQPVNLSPPSNANSDPTWDCLQGESEEWVLRDSKGAIVPDLDFPFIRKMNISSYCPVVNGKTFSAYLLDWLNGSIFSTGLWDGLFLDNLFGQANPHFPNRYDPALFDVDFNRNGFRDDSPAVASDLTRAGAVGFLTELRAVAGDAQLIVGNAGPLPDLALAPFANGYVFECVNLAWSSQYLPRISPAGWRTAYEAYRRIQGAVRAPRINILEGCGPYALAPGSGYSTPTSADFQNHRLVLGTALLNDGFYSYDLHGNLSAPLWFDEYSVDSTGVAVKDRTKKGYLGRDLSGAVVMAEPGTLVFQEDFEGGSFPSSFTAFPAGAAFLTSAPGEVIAGTGSLVVSNPDHTKQGFVAAGTVPAAVPLAPSRYLVTFDWRVLETLDSGFGADVFGSGQSLDSLTVPGIVAGDFGTANLPITVPGAGDWSIRFFVTGGGGKVAVDNVRVYRGGVGPWRRDFENGFVLVNPFNEARTFSPSDLAGPFGRTGIRRIKGTQAPDVNNGQAMTGSLTLAPFDAIILLADHIASSLEPIPVPRRTLLPRVVAR